MKMLRKRLLRPAIAGVLLLFLISGLGACTVVRPVTKIGVIGSFEGLYRRTGYTILDATRSALSDPAAPADFIPLALDDSGVPERAQRAAAKLSLDSELAAIIGPFLPATLARASHGLAADIDWIVPFAVDPAGGFAHPQDTATWLSYLVTEVARAAQEQGRSRLVLAGWPDATVEPGNDNLLPVAIINSPDELVAGDALLWLGDPDGAARFLPLLREKDGTIPFWLAPWGYDPIFIERTSSTENVYWIIWSDSGYNDRKLSRAPSTANAYLTYLATRQVMALAADTPVIEVPEWHALLYEIDSNGDPVPLRAN